MYGQKHLIYVTNIESKFQNRSNFRRKLSKAFGFLGKARGMPLRASVPRLAQVTEFSSPIFSRQRHAREARPVRAAGLDESEPGDE